MGHWTISWALEPVYVDDPWDNPNYHDPYEEVEREYYEMLEEEASAGERKER